LPHLTDGEVRLALRGMWDNLGRTAAELPHLGLLARDTERVAIVDSDGILAELSRDGGGAVLVSAHYGNWEIASLPALRAGIVQHSVYRAPNNPAVDRLISRLRRPNLLGEFIRKGRKGLWGIVAALRAGEAVGKLVDQKLKEGVIVPFFGRDARTTDAPAALSYRFGVPIVLIKVERLRGARFRIWVSRFGAVDEKDDQDSFIEPTRQLNAILEDWVRERPDQWLWAHRRWHN
jgi:KDO2-lipid IV(A) lauroyltransferase